MSKARDVANLLTNTYSKTEASSLFLPANSPAFSARSNSSASPQAFPNDGTQTKVAIWGVNYDLTGAFNTSLYRFLPTMAGYYEVSGFLPLSFYYDPSYWEPLTATITLSIRKNGDLILGGYGTLDTTAVYFDTPYSGSVLLEGETEIFLNGTTDYIELYMTCLAPRYETNVRVDVDRGFARFSAHRIRGA